MTVGLIWSELEQEQEQRGGSKATVAKHYSIVSHEGMA